MGNKVLLKKSSVTGKIPSTSDLDYGEVALNFTDGRLYFKNSNDDINFFDNGVSTKALLPFAANEANFGNTSSESTYFFNLGSIQEEEIFDYNLGIIETTEVLIQIFEQDSNLGSVTLSANEEYSLGSIAELISTDYDLGFIVTSGIIFASAFVLPSFTVANLPQGITGQMLLVTNEINGTVPAFFDGSNWKRLSDNQTVSIN